MNSALFVPTRNPFEIYVPVLARTFHGTELAPFSRTFKCTGDRKKPTTFTPTVGDLFAFGSISVKLPPGGFQVAMDRALELEDPKADQLILYSNKREVAELSLFWLDTMFPKLMDIPPFALGDDETLKILGPPGALVTLDGIVRHPLGR